jgi:hypothetical protein
MEKNHAIIFLIFIALVIFWLIGNTSTKTLGKLDIPSNLTKSNPRNVSDNPEYFTMTENIANPMTGHDNYKIWNSISHSNISPNYNSTHNNMVKLKYIIKPPKKRINWHKENFDKDNFIEVQGNKVRRELVPSNYVDINYASPNFIESDMSEHIAPQAFNFYFKK